MHVSYNLTDWRTRLRTLEEQSIGFVPTMGALHPGHGSLVERCRSENDVAVVSIFVNPSQFNDEGDLSRYPRTVEQDLALLESLGAHEVIVPGGPELYPKGYRLHLEPHSSDLVLEGAYRPGFLQGVMTIVLKLLSLVRAERAYFGEKDYQQLMTVTEMAREFFLPTQIVACPTVRHPSGLAMSSRNALLSPQARDKAAYLFHVLTTTTDCVEARAALERQGFAVEYVEERWARRLAAVRLEGVRLIDNVPDPKIATIPANF